MEPVAHGRSATAGAGDLLRLGLRLTAGFLRHGRGFDAGRTGCQWMRELAARDGGKPLRVRLGGRTLEVVIELAPSEGVSASACSICSACRS